MATGGSASAAAVQIELQMEQETDRHESQLANEYPAVNLVYAKERIGGQACNSQFCLRTKLHLASLTPVCRRGVETACGDLTHFNCLVLECGLVKKNGPVRFGSWS
jgi:hypothetical protein